LFVYLYDLYKEYLLLLV